MKKNIKDQINCSFCGMNQSKTDLLVEGSDAYICKTCIIKSYSVISESKKSNNLENFEHLKPNLIKAQLDKLQAIGGVNAIVPSEGIVFKYNGKTYKFTGAFAPINQITGLISF